MVFSNTQAYLEIFSYSYQKTKVLLHLLKILIPHKLTTSSDPEQRIRRRLGREAVDSGPCLWLLAGRFCLLGDNMKCLGRQVPLASCTFLRDTHYIQK